MDVDGILKYNRHTSRNKGLDMLSQKIGIGMLNHKPRI